MLFTDYKEAFDVVNHGRMLIIIMKDTVCGVRVAVPMIIPHADPTASIIPSGTSVDNHCRKSPSEHPLRNYQ